MLLQPRAWSRSSMLFARGAVALLFAGATFFLPQLAFSSVVFAFALYLLLDGALAVSGSYLVARHRWLSCAAGVAAVGCGVGILCFDRGPGTALTLRLGCWAVASGVLELALGLRLRREVGASELVLASLLSVGLGAELLLQPHLEAAMVAVLLATYASLFGMALLLAAHETRRRARALHDEGARLDT